MPSVAKILCPPVAYQAAQWLALEELELQVLDFVDLTAGARKYSRDLCLGSQMLNGVVAFPP